MNYKIFLLLLIDFTYAFDENHLNNLQEQVSMGQRICAVGFNLQGADIRRINLEGADFTNANLKGVDFSGANLSKALFIHADLSKVNFHQAKLTEADLTDAIINGAKFKEASLLGIQYHFIRSAKGTLFEDKQELLEKLTHEQKIDTIKKEFLNGATCFLSIDKAWSLRKIHEYLYERLNEFYEDGREYIILDFHSLSFSNEKLEGFRNSSLEASGIEKVQQCVEFLQTPFFSVSVKKVMPIWDSQAIIVFLKDEDIGLPKKSLYYKSLDLHGKFPLDVKYRWIDNFIKTASCHHTYTIEIITGRGIHNPHGKMGVLWNLCRQYLLSEKFESYIQEIHPINKQGGWKIILKDSQQNRRGKSKNINFYTTSFYGSHPAFKNPKLIIVPSKKDIKSISSGKTKRSKKGKSKNQKVFWRQKRKWR